MLTAKSDFKLQRQLRPHFTSLHFISLHGSTSRDCPNGERRQTCANQNRPSDADCIEAETDA